MKQHSKGQISVTLLFFAGLTVVLISGFVFLASSFLQLSVRSLNKVRVFSIAEAGIEYYRWHLAHAPQDFQDGTGHGGPYIHNYYDKDGTLLGNFSLVITPPPPGSTVVTIRSSGFSIADPSISKVIEVKMAIPSLTKYAILVNSNILFGPGTEVFGEIRSNGGIHFDGLAHNLVSSALTTYQDPNDSNKTEWAVHTDVAPADASPPSPLLSRPDVFMTGRTVGLPAVDFTQITQTLSNLKSQAQTSGTYFASSSAYGYDLALATSGIYSMYKITALAGSPNGNSCNNTSNEPGWGIWSVKSESLQATGTIPDNGVIFAEDNLWIRGQINGKHVTIGAGRFPENPSTYANITVNSSTLYTNYNGNDTIGYVAQNNFNVGLYSEDILRIDGAIVAKNGRIGRFYYSPPNDNSNSNKCGPTVVRQQITFYGTIISNQGYELGFDDDTGYIKRILIYDTNLFYSPPPSFPLTTDQYSIISWNEIQ